MLPRERLPRTKSLAEGASVNPGSLSGYGWLPASRTLRPDEPTPAGVLIDRGQSGGRMRTAWGCGVRPLLFPGDGIGQRDGISPSASKRFEAHQLQGL